MTAAAIALCILAQVFLVVGQLLFKHAMDERSRRSLRRKVALLSVGIAAQAVWFFLWLGLLERWDLSRIFPFEGLNPLLIVICACLVLRERLTADGWVGVALITAGLILVARTG